MMLELCPAFCVESVLLDLTKIPGQTLVTRHSVAPSLHAFLSPIGAEGRWVPARKSPRDSEALGRGLFGRQRKAPALATGPRPVPSTRWETGGLAEATFRLGRGLLNFRQSLDAKLIKGVRVVPVLRPTQFKDGEHDPEEQLRKRSCPSRWRATAPCALDMRQL
jgi:hypothetical protein